MKKSDKRITHSPNDYFDLFSNIKIYNKIILLELRTAIKEKKDVLLVYALSRACVQIESILELWRLQHYSDCLILYRTQVERLLTLHYLVDTKTINEFDDWSFIQNFEARNKIKSDPEQKSHLNKEFWKENLARITRYQRLKASNITWQRPSPDQLEKTSKDHDIHSLFKYGYKYASGFVHPLSSDGEDEFSHVTGIQPKTLIVYDKSPIINNSMLVYLFIIQLALNETKFEWNNHVFKVAEKAIEFLNGGNKEYIKHLNCVIYMINNNKKILR